MENTRWSGETMDLGGKDDASGAYWGYFWAYNKPPKGTHIKESNYDPLHWSSMYFCKNCARDEVISVGPESLQLNHTLFHLPPNIRD